MVRTTYIKKVSYLELRTIDFTQSISNTYKYLEEVPTAEDPESDCCGSVC